MRLTSVVALALLLAACDGNIVVGTHTNSPAAASPAASAPSSPFGSTGGLGAIEHATGPTDVLLRLEEFEGFVALALFATQAPIFTLYGDGSVIFRNPNLDPLPTDGSVAPLRSFRTTRLSEDQIQAVLADALGRGGLGVARTDYPDDQIADAPTTIFTISAGGIEKSVAVYALGIDVGSSPDAPARAAFLDLSARLKDFDNGGTLSTDEYVPDRYRGSLLEGETPAPDTKPWPWTEIAPADFVSDSGPSQFPLTAHMLSVGDVEALGISPYRGGLHGLTLIGPGDGKTYSFSLRPLLPDEAR